MKKLFLAMAIAIVTATAVSAQEDKMVISTVQADKDNGYEGNTATRCGIKFNIKLSGVTKVELEKCRMATIWQVRQVSKRILRE